MLRRMAKAYRAILTNFHKPLSPIITFVAILLLRLLVAAGMLLDRLFIHSISRQIITKPIVIVGNPRSGTTFLQRFLVDRNIGAGMQLWKMIFPALTLQKLFKPLLPMMEKMSPARFHAHAAHETNLSAIETDDPLFLFHFFDGFFVYGFFLAWLREDVRADFDPAVRDTSTRDFEWLEKVWKRNLIGERQHQIIAKLFSLSVRIPQFLTHFPDAKILYTVRDPLETVPSGLSLVTGVLDGRFGFWNLPEDKRTCYIDRLYRALLELTLRFHEDYMNGKIPKENVFIVRYDQMMNDFDGIMQKICAFIGMDVTPALRESIQKTSESQRHYKSKHQYDLAKFGLTKDIIRKDYDKIYKSFLNTDYTMNS